MRLWNWKSRLAAYVSACAAVPYQIGLHDCALFAAGAVMAVTGVDPAAGFRGRYETKAAGLRLVRAQGYANHVDLAAQTLPEIAPALAAAGDIALVADADDAEALGVVQGEMVYVLRQTGLGLAPRTGIRRAFRT